MVRINRRDFLKTTPAAVAAVSALRQPRATATEPVTSPLQDGSDGSPAIPPHQPMGVPGVHAYAEKSIEAGSPVHFRISSTVPYEFSVCRLGLDVENFESDQVLHTFAEADPKPQDIHPGSYVHVEDGFEAGRKLDAISLECWIRPWNLKADQGLLTKFDPAGDCGFGLFLGQRGQLKFYLGDGGKFRSRWFRRGPRLNHERQWHHVVVTWNGKMVTLYLDGIFHGSWKFAGPLKPGRTPLRLAAAGQAGKAVNFYDGDLCMPIIYGRALAAKEVKQRFQTQGLQPPAGKGVLACWPLSEEKGDKVADISGHAHHGKIINRATWMIGGPSFDGAAIPRHAEYDPDQDATRGHALRFASDDLYDCRWEVTQQYRMPKEAPSGLYVGRFRFEIEGKPRIYHVTFLVRRAPDRPKAPILMLCSTNTWIAYSATPFAANAPNRQFWETYGLPNSAAGAPSYSCYLNHQHGQPSFGFGMKMPWPVAGPDVLFSRGQVGYSHLMRGERFAHNWLREAGYEYDVAADYDLHRNPEMLEGYKVVIINGHSEYWSVEAYQGVDKFLSQGGSAIVMSGNTMFWRVTYDDKDQVMECRKFDSDIGGRPAATVGELFHSHDKKRGSLMRYCGYPAWKVLGLECIGWWGLDKDNFGVYEVTDADHSLFQKPHQVELRNGETFGHAPGGGLPRVGGHESDVRLGRIRQITHHFPEGTSFPDEPPGIKTLAQVVMKGRRGIDYFGRWTPLEHGVVGEMTYWDRPQGGHVFHCGCIATAWSLSADPNLQALMRNVLHHFGVEANKA